MCLDAPPRQRQQTNRQRNTTMNRNRETRIECTDWDEEVLDEGVPEAARLGAQGRGRRGARQARPQARDEASLVHRGVGRAALPGRARCPAGAGHLPFCGVWSPLLAQTDEPNEPSLAARCGRGITSIITRRSQNGYCKVRDGQGRRDCRHRRRGVTVKPPIILPRPSATPSILEGGALTQALPLRQGEWRVAPRGYDYIHLTGERQ